MSEERKPFDETFEEVGALWKTKTGKGLSGKLKIALPAGTRILAFPNKGKSENQPDVRLYVPKDELPAGVADDKPEGSTESDDPFGIF